MRVSDIANILRAASELVCSAGLVLVTWTWLARSRDAGDAPEPAHEFNHISAGGWTLPLLAIGSVIALCVRVVAAAIGGASRRAFDAHNGDDRYALADKVKFTWLALGRPPKFATLPSSLTENLYNSLKVKPDSGSTL